MTAVAHQVGTTRALKTSVLFDLRDVRMAQSDGAYTGAVDIVMLDLNDQNKILGAVDQTFQLKLPPDLYAKLLKEGVSLTKELPIAPDAVSCAWWFAMPIRHDGNSENPHGRLFPGQASRALSGRFDCAISQFACARNYEPAEVRAVNPSSIASISSLPSSLTGSSGGRGRPP